MDSYGVFIILSKNRILYFLIFGEVVGLLLGFLGFIRFLIGYFVWFSGLSCWVLLDFVGFCWILLDFVGFCWILLDFDGFCWILLGSVGFLLGCRRILTGYL